MNENNITRFEVSNFKKFDHLVVENIGQVNLITGDNNVGKTTLLEAFVLEPKLKRNISLLWHVLHNRNFKFDTQRRHDINDLENNQKTNIIGLFQKDVSKPVCIKYTKNKKHTEFVIRNEILDVIKTSNTEIREFVDYIKDYPKIDLYSKNWLLFYFENELEYMVDLTSDYYHQFFSYEKYDTLISLRDFYDEDLIEFYEKIAKDSEKKKNFIDIINSVFTERITDIEKRSFLNFDRLMITTEKNKIFHSVTNYGDGVVRTLRICLEILMNEDKRMKNEGKRIMNERIMIDEVEVGVHYLKMKDEWKAIFELSKQTGIQIFATTHSMDCIKAFVEAGDENEEMRENLRLIELEEFKLKDGTNKQLATTFTHSQLEASLNSELNVRGGKLW